MALQFRTLSKFGRAYILGVSAVGLLVAAHSLGQLFVQRVDPQWLVLAALTLLTGAFTVRIPGISAELSVSDTFVIVSVLLFGPAAGTIIALLDALIISLRAAPNARKPLRIMFNVSAVALSSNAAGQVFFGVAGIRPFSIEPTPVGQILLPLFLCALTYFLLNSWLITFALAIDKQLSPFPLWRDNFLWLSVNYFVGGSLAGLLVTFSREIDLATLGIIVPLLLISYLTFKTSLGRIEDANQHLTRVNKLYLSTIETLAMAIDAKDQITHGHIRRVQRLAVGLAKTMGVDDDLQIRAIEAAALLHDMGKLAIPEFILNKPGRLTANEFDVMKQHANIGAEILGSIQFPYPVVPIVRHHHESWDGNGYPDKIKGVAIPLGARILSVVDCFDALTSDRPYRPRMSVEAAIGVLLERRGTMYDPLIVDKFIEAQEELSRIAESSEADTEAIDTIATKLRLSPEPPQPTLADAHERLPLRALALLRSIKPSPSGTSITDLGVIVSKQLSKLAPFSALAIYCTAEDGRTLRCRYAEEPLNGLADVSEIPFGERLSGWVAAHRTPIWNSDATLDLAPELAKNASIALGSSVALVDGDLTVGTLTFYSKAGDEISVEQRLLIQSVAPLLATAVSSALAHDEVVGIDATNQNDREALYSVLDALLSSRAQWSDRSNPDRQVIVRVTWRVDTTAPERHTTMQETLDRAIASATSSSGYVIRLSSADLLIAAPQKHLVSAGLAPTASQRPRAVNIQVAEIANSLELREVLKLTATTEQPVQGKPLIH